MMRRVVLLSGVALALFNCSYNDIESVKTGEPIFTLLSNPNVGKGMVNWLMIHSADGKLLSAQKFTPGDGVMASSNSTKEDDLVNVTFMQYSIQQGFGGYIYNLSTYLNIPLHETWTIQPAPAQHSTAFSSTFKVTSTGFPTSSRINISNVFGGFVLLTFDGSFISYATDIGVDEATKNYFFSCRDPQGNLEYKFLPNVQTGDTYTIGPTDLKPAESSIQVPLTQMKEYTLYVTGVADSESIATNGYIAHNDYGESPLPSNVTIGFPAVFNSFRTNLGMTNNNGTYYFHSVGPKPTEITMPTNQVYKITNRTIQNFGYLGNDDFQRRTSVWEYHNWWHGENPPLKVDVIWTVYGPPSVAQKISELPSNFSTSYPDLKFETLLHTSTTFGLQGYPTLDDLINTSFKGQSQPTIQKYYSVTLN